jgi:hypothetical protein
MYFGALPCILALSDFSSLPQRAGYSLQELFHLTRSQVSQQRVLALHVLSQVIGRVSGLLTSSYPDPSHPHNLRFPRLLPFPLWVSLRLEHMHGCGWAKTLYNFSVFSKVLSSCPQAQAGEFGDRLVGSVLCLLLDAGFLFLLRFSLDDRVDGVIAAAIRALRALLVAPGDEVQQG